MRRIFLGLILVANLSAADWYADSGSKAMSAVVWYPTPTTSCAAGTGTPLVWGAQASGDNFFANGCTAISVGADPGPNGTVTLRTDAGPVGGTAGGGFTYATASNLTLHVNLLAGTTSALTISGSTGGGTITGNLTGGSGTSARAVSDTHTGAGVTITVQGTITGGSGTGDYGYYIAAASTVVVNGNVSPGSVASVPGLTTTSASSVVTVNGICFGSDSVNSIGCSGLPGGMTVTGPLVNGKNGMATTAAQYVPAAGSYICMPKDSTYAIGTEDCTHTGGAAGLSSHAIEMPTDPGLANVKTGTGYGTFTGTLTGGTHGFVN